MKSVVRSIGINSFALFLLPQALLGVKIFGGFQTILLSGFILTILLWVLKPILNIITLPLNLLTFGIFSFLINIIILYLLTLLVPQFSISAFTFQGFSFAGFIIPKIAFNQFFAFMAASFVFSAIVNIIKWIIK